MGSIRTRRGDPRSTMPVMTAVYEASSKHFPSAISNNQQTFVNSDYLSEHAYLSACIDAGRWAPDADGLSINNFPASSGAFKWLGQYAAAEDGKAPPLQLLQQYYPDIVYIPRCGRKWARDVLLDDWRKRGVVKGLREALTLVRDDSTDQAMSVLRQTLEVGSHGFQAGVGLADVAEEDAGRKLPPLYRAIEACGGITEGDYVLILARTNVGKSFRLMQHAVECARAGKSVLYFSLEMRAGRCANRLHPMILGDSSQRMDWNERSKATKTWLAEHDAKFRLIDDSAGPMSTESIARLSKPGDVVFIDYIGLMKDAMGARMSQDWHTASAITNTLRSLTTGHGLTVFAGAQANRAGGNGMPDDMNVGMSDSIPQDIDLGIALQRKRRDLPFTINSVFKARNGAIVEGKWFTMFEPSTGNYAEITAEEAWEMSEDLERNDIL